jgi:hypothetical protein
VDILSEIGLVHQRLISMEAGLPKY